MGEGKPVITVLEGEFPVFGLERISDRAELRIVSSHTLLDAIPDTRILFLWDFFSPAVNGIYGHARNLEWVHIAATGVDKLLVPELVESPVLVTNAHGVFDQPIAEYVLGCIASLFKDIPRSLALQRAADWQTRVTRNLTGTAVLVVGAGGIGRATARLLRAVGMRVTVMGRTERPDDEFGTIASSDLLLELIGDFEAVVVAAPLTPQTKNLLSADVIGAMRPGAVLVNVGRGQTVDQHAVSTALASGHLAGAALDAFDVEPLPADDPLWTLPRMFVSPHMASRTTGWLERLVDQFCWNFEAWLAGEPMQGVVDKNRGYVV